MAMIFEVQPGFAVRLPGGAGLELPIHVGDFADSLDSRSIITQISVRRGENVQFVHTLGDLIYVYSFGERIGQVMVAGLSFIGLCNNADSGGPDRKTGIEYVLDWYESHRVGAVAGPLTIVIGGARGVFRAYLTGMEVDVAKPEFRLANFSFQFASLPIRKRELINQR